MIDLNSFFGDIYCINLDRRVDRWEQSLLEFKKSNVGDVKRFSAVDGKMIEPKGILTSGEIGALRSHLEVIKLAKLRGLSSVLILEDDVEFAPDFLGKFLNVYNKVPKNWDLLYLGANHAPARPVFVADGVAKMNGSYAIHAYAVKSTIYDRLIGEIQKEERQVDVYLAEAQRVCEAYVVRPHLAFQRDGFSDIQNGEVKYDFLRY